jgi:hypothetical protein
MVTTSPLRGTPWSISEKPLMSVPAGGMACPATQLSLPLASTLLAASSICQL